MRDVLNRILRDKDLKLDAVLHVGAGTGSELELYREHRADKVMLVEANPMLADRLRQKVRGFQNIEVTAAAVADAAGEAQLWMMNNPRESSLCRPDGLLRRYPNLKVTQNIPVRTLTLDALIDQLAPAVDGANVLVLEMQGMELAALSATATEKLQRFFWIAVRSAKYCMNTAQSMQMWIRTCAIAGFWLLRLRHLGRNRRYAACFIGETMHKLN
jgi:FkbM family methyltransferase